MGTCRMGVDPSKSVVDAAGACHGVENLFIADSSVFTTGSCVNPTNTIQAVALHIGQQIVDKGDRRMTCLDQLLDRMMPGDSTRGLPSFGTLGIDLETHFLAKEFSAVEDIMSRCGEETDVNLLLKSLRADLPDLARTLTERALNLYFSHPIITAPRSRAHCPLPS